MTRVFSVVSLLCFFSFAPSAHAIQTASSFDLSWAAALLNLNTTQTSNGAALPSQRINSFTGLQLDYNVALFDYRTVATFSFTQFQTSSFGTSQIPMSRIGLGVSYHLFRINGERIILDNQVEGKIWGVSPALELSLGLNRLSVKNGAAYDFTAGIIDAIPRLLIEVPMSSTFLMMLRVGTYMTLQGSNAQYKISLTGTVLNLGFKLTTL